MQDYPHPLWSVAVYSVILPGVVALLWNRVDTFWPDASVLIGMAIAAMIWMLGYRYFGGRFVKPVWKAYGKGVGFVVIAYFLLIWLGPWAWPILLIHQGIGWVCHLIICRRYGINWLTVEPSEKYVALMEKWGRGDFG